MKLEHLMQAYKQNGIDAELKEMDSEDERAGVINYGNGISASYLLDEEEIVVAMKMFFNCLTGDKLTISNQILHTTKVIQVMQNTIMLLANIPQKEANLILKTLGLFNGTFKKRKESKASRS